MMGLIKLYLLTLFLSNCLCDEDTVGYAGMVSSTNHYASQVGRNILAMGGTAADAAVAVQMALNVVQPTSAGLGGGAFIMYYDAKTGEIRAIDGREEAPNAFNPYVFCQNITCYNTNGAEGDCSDCAVIPFGERASGGLSVGVPGTLYAFKRLWEIYGIGQHVITWKDLFTDAIDLAQNGFTMYEGLLELITRDSVLEKVARYNSSCKLLLNYPDCTESKYAVGDIVTFTDLANTFTILSSMTADEAINEFYEGDIASAIVNTVQSAINPMTGRTGLITKDDLAGYRAVFREPMSTTIQFDTNGKKYDIYGMNMPSSGPLTVQYQLKMLEFLQTDSTFDSYHADSFKNDPYSVETLHYLFSAANIAFADRNQYMADNDFVNVPLDGMQDDDYLEQRAIDHLNKTAQKLPVDFGHPAGYNDTLKQSSVSEGGTAHICIVDQWGNIASITTTIEGILGSDVAVDGYGFFLNNELTDFSSKGIINGVVVANGPEGGKKQRMHAINILNYNDQQTSGGKRPRSSMSPTIILSDGTPIMVIGGRGGPTIIGGVANIIIRRFVHNMNIQDAVNAARVWGMNGNPMRFEKSLWEKSNSNITNQLVYRFGYDVASLYDWTYGSINSIVIGDNNMLYCGVDKSRWAVEGCVAVCNSSDSSCPFSMTTVYPKSTEIETTVDDSGGLDEVCIDDEYNWIISITFHVPLRIDPSTTANRMKIRDSCKRAFFRTIFMILMDWLDDFCFDLTDEQLTINEYIGSNSRRLLQTEYEIDAGFEYNDDLQDMVFANKTLFDKDDFGTVFSDELIDVLIEENIINANDTDNFEVIVESPEEYKEDEKDHKVEGALINTVVIIAIIDILIFLACLIYFVRNTRERVSKEGDIDWKDARKKYKLPYWMACVEILDSLIHWIFAIITITIPTYLGWILFCLLLGGEIVLYIRYSFYKQLILYQVPKLRKEITLKSELNDEIIARRTDIGILGIALGTVEDIPVIIIIFIVGENFGYNAIEVISLIIALISVCMKIALFFNARFSSTEQPKHEQNVYGADKSIQLAEDKKEEKDTLANKNTNDVVEEETDAVDTKDGGHDEKTKGEEEPINKDKNEYID